MRSLHQWRTVLRMMSLIVAVAAGAGTHPVYPTQHEFDCPLVSAVAAAPHTEDLCEPGTALESCCCCCGFVVALPTLLEHCQPCLSTPALPRRVADGCVLVAQMALSLRLLLGPATARHCGPAPAPAPAPTFSNSNAATTHSSSSSSSSSRNHGSVATAVAAAAAAASVATAVWLPRCGYRSVATAVWLPRCGYRGVAVL